MAKIGEITVPINYEITETSKVVLKWLILEILQSDEFKKFIRAEVGGAFADTVRNMRMQSGMERQLS